MRGLTRCPLRGSGLHGAAPGNTTRSPELCSGMAGCVWLGVKVDCNCSNSILVLVLLDTVNAAERCIQDPKSQESESICVLVTGCCISASCHHHKDLFINESEENTKPKAVIFLLLLQTNVAVMALGAVARFPTHFPNRIRHKMYMLSLSGAH